MFTSQSKAIRYNYSIIFDTDPLKQDKRSVGHVGTSFCQPCLEVQTINYYLLNDYYNEITMESIDVLPPEKIAFIAYNIGVYESVQKFGGLITSGKITNGTDVSKIAELLLESSAFYDAELISSLINTMLYHTKNSTIVRVTPTQVIYVMSQLKASGVSLP
ncbi:MAG: hypothetical protein WCC17_08625 [Candidatus Nitrosopolaris sp.]